MRSPPSGWTPGLALALFVLGSLSGPGCTCGPESATSGPAAASSASSAVSSAAPAAAPPVRLVIDGVATPDLAVSALAPRAERVDLETLLPPGTAPRAEWRQLIARGGPRFVDLQSMQRLYPDQQLALYRDAEGRPCFGAFRRVEADMPLWMRQKLAEPVVSLVGVESLELRTRERPEATAADSLEVTRRGAAPVPLELAKLLALPTIKPLAGVPGDGRKRGHALQAVLGLALTPKELARVSEVVVWAGEESRRFTGAELRGDDVVPVLKRNRKGIWKLLVYRRNGTNDELAPVRRIDIDPPRAAVAAPTASARPR